MVLIKSLSTKQCSTGTGRGAIILYQSLTVLDQTASVSHEKISSNDKLLPTALEIANGVGPSSLQSANTLPEFAGRAASLLLLRSRALVFA